MPPSGPRAGCCNLPLSYRSIPSNGPKRGGPHSDRSHDALSVPANERGIRVSQRTLIAGLIGGAFARARTLGRQLEGATSRAEARLLLLFGCDLLDRFSSPGCPIGPNYWILGRQWIASIALACVAVLSGSSPRVVNFFAPRMRVIAVLASVAVLGLFDCTIFAGAADRQLVRLGGKWSTEQQRAAESPRLAAR